MAALMPSGAAGSAEIARKQCHHPKDEVGIPLRESHGCRRGRRMVNRVRDVARCFPKAIYELEPRVARQPAQATAEDAGDCLGATGAQVPFPDLEHMTACSDTFPVPAGAQGGPGLVEALGGARLTSILRGKVDLDEASSVTPEAGQHLLSPS